MNCKPTDLAWIVQSDFPENIRKIVRVLSPAPEPGFWNVLALSPLRVCKFSLVFGILGRDYVVPAGTECVVHDAALRPIRGEEGADETLAWKTVPQPAAPELPPKPQREFAL